MFNAKEVDAALRALVEANHLAGVSVCVKNADGTLFTGNYGIRDAAGEKPVDSETMFGIASMSKSITALAACILETEGKLSLEDPVTKYFPDFRVPGNPKDTVTIRNLCRHDAGIPPMEPLEWSIAMNSAREESDWLRQMRETSPNQMDKIEQIIDYIANCGYKTLGAPGEVMSYCNEGFAILSYIVDQAAGIPLEQYAAERIFVPLGMTRTIMDDDCVTARALSGGNITSLFEREDGVTRCDDNWSILPPFRGCAMVKSTAPDMASYYQALSNGGIHNGVQAIPAAAVERLIGAEFPVTSQDVYCLGLNKYTMNGHIVCEHAGGLHGVSTKGALFLGENTGFAVLCNQGDEDMDELMWVLYSAIAGLPLDTCWRRYIPNGRAFSDPEMLVGEFVGHEGVPSHVRVWLEDGKLCGSRDDTKVSLVWCGGTRFLGYASPDAKAPCARVEFLIRDGQAWGARVGTRVFGRI